MSKKNESIVIRLNPNYHVGRENYIPSQEEELAELIIDRVRKYENFVKENKHLSKEMLYEQVKRYDSVHIDGARGSGKSTVIKFLTDSKDCNVCSELQEKVEYLSLVDPNQLDKNTNIIDIVTDVIYSRITEFYRHMKSKDRELHKKISDYKCKIDKLTFRTQKKDYENPVVRQETTRDERNLDYTFHQYAEACCTLLGKKALVLPIDDIDMRLDVGVAMLETIRKYFQTPHLIPVIALDSGQAYALVKKDYYEKFNYKANMDNRDIGVNSGMVFLKKLPSEYLQKILPPSQRVALYDMLDYYKDEYCKKGKDESYKPIYFYKELKTGSKKKKDITLSFAELLKLIMNVLFDYKDTTGVYSPDDYRIVNYLKNKSFRSFLDDARALMRGLEFDDNFKTYKTEKVQTYRLNTRSLKTRFELYGKPSASNKYDGARWFWDRYIDRVYAELDKVGKKDDFYKVDYIVTDLLNEILVIDPNDTSSLGRKEKIYYRLFLQEFFIDQTNIEFSELDEYGYRTVERVIKTYNMQGYLEFIMRTLFPASMFEALVNDKIISVLKFPVEQLKDFASPNNKTSLKKLYDEWLPFWTRQYSSRSKENNSDTKIDNFDTPLAIKIDENHIEFFKKDILTYTIQKKYIKGEEYFIHPFKLLSFLAEYKYDSPDIFYQQYLPKEILNKNNDALLSLQEKVKKYDRKKTLIHASEDLLLLSIIDSISRMQNLSKNIIVSLSKLANMKENIHAALKGSYDLTDTHAYLIYQVELKKNLSGIYSEFLNTLVSIIFEQATFTLSSDTSNYFIYPPFKASTQEGMILLPFIKDDYLMQNLRFVKESSFAKENDLISFIKTYYLMCELDSIYFPNHETDGKFLFDVIITDEEAITKLIDKNPSLKEAYIYLFKGYLKKYKLITIFKQLWIDMRKVGGKVSDIESENDFGINISQKSLILGFIDKLKSHKDLPDNTYIDRNIAILFIDALGTLPKIVQDIVSILSNK
jgi:hypothetical protein